MNDKERIRQLEEEIARDRDMYTDLLRDANSRAATAEARVLWLEREIVILREQANCLTFKGGKALDKWIGAQSPGDKK